MEYSKIVQTLKRDYMLDPCDVFFAILCAAGCSRAESFAHIYRPKTMSDSSLKNGAAALVKSKPALAKLILDLQARQTSPISAELNSSRLAARLKREEAARASGGWDENQTAAENGIRILKEAIGVCEGKEKADLTFKLLRLVGVQIDERESINYYLPLSCRDCSLYQNSTAAK